MRRPAERAMVTPLAMSHRWSGGESAAPNRSAANTFSSGGTEDASGAQAGWPPLPLDEPVGHLGG
eukprot:1845524-Alexandrium_andersonii.AAC.1